jgi:hypothetical protein
MDFDSIGANKSEKAAIHDFFIHVNLPILIQEGEKFGIIATGTLFKIAGRSFLITAARTMESHQPCAGNRPNLKSRKSRPSR